uniref:Secreted protein n=1 Tax=Heterorhabditis bacteriophora TaxID=37862 RepID=A0A1I7WTI3_HETBA
MSAVMGNCSTSTALCVQFLSHLANVVIDNTVQGVLPKTSSAFTALSASRRNRYAIVSSRAKIWLYSIMNTETGFGG